MAPNEIKKLVSEYKDDINKLNQNLDDIQSMCKHISVEIKNLNPTTAELRKVCKDCEKVIGYPNQQELRDAGYEL